MGEPVKSGHARAEGPRQSRGFSVDREFLFSQGFGNTAAMQVLHADLIGAADRNGFTHIIAEKPAVVCLEAIAPLRQVQAKVAICHGYRQMWGPQVIQAAIQKGELGRLISIEGHYWQSSAAAFAASRPGIRRNVWKNDPALSGPYDVLMDLGTHWADLVTYLSAGIALKAKGWLSYSNAEAPHRDTHLHLEMDFTNGVRSWGSVSKTVHGAANDLEVMVLGERGLMKWSFEKPDQLLYGQGKELRTLFRSADESAASQLPPHHALGWLEGYVSIFTQVVRNLGGDCSFQVPTLRESLDLAQVLLAIDFNRQL